MYRGQKIAPKTRFKMEVDRMDAYDHQYAMIQNPNMKAVDPSAPPLKGKKNGNTAQYKREQRSKRS